MARIESDYDIRGTYGNMVVYQVGDRLYARTRSSLTGKRFWKSKAFANSREKARQFGWAAVIAKAIYATLPREVKRQGLFGKLTGWVQRSLHEGKTKEAIVKEMLVHLEVVPVAEMTKATKPVGFALKKKRKQPRLSTWQVTATGRLQRTTLPNDKVIQSFDYDYAFVVYFTDG